MNPIYLIHILFGLGLVALIVTVVRAFRSHDPARAAHTTTVAADGSFSLEIPAGPGGHEVYFRFHLGAIDTDLSYDVGVGAEVEVEGKRLGERVEWYTGDHGPVVGFATPGRAQRVGSTHALSGGSGSFLLLTVPRSRACTVRGVARTTSAFQLIRGDVYLPR